MNLRYNEDFIQKAMDDRKVKIEDYDSKSGKLLSQTRD